jgi:hypothetical protein
MSDLNEIFNNIIKDFFDFANLIIYEVSKSKKLFETKENFNNFFKTLKNSNNYLEKDLMFFFHLIEYTNFSNKIIDKTKAAEKIDLLDNHTQQVYEVKKNIKLDLLKKVLSLPEKNMLDFQINNYETQLDMFYITISSYNQKRPKHAIQYPKRFSDLFKEKKNYNLSYE